MNKGIFLRMSSWSQLFFLALFVFAGIILATLLVAVCSGGSAEKLQSADFLRVMQLFQATLLFLIPAGLCAYLFHEQPLSYLKINKSIDFKFLSVALLLILVIQPFISFSGYYNNLITLPKSLSGLEKMMREMEDSTNQLMEKFLTTDSASIFMLNVFIIAIMAGVTEEFFFRGSLQQILKKICNNRHIAVWITAIIFSAIHFQFYGFFPRMFLGAILGYLFVWSGNLWISVIVHAFNNFLSLLIFQLYHGTPEYDIAESIGTTPNTMWITVLSVVLSGVILFFLSRDYTKNNPEEFSL